MGCINTQIASIVAIGVGICLCISLIIAIPLQTAGYNRHVNENGLLIDTDCIVVSHAIKEVTCYRQCNCVTYVEERCTTKRDRDGNTHRTCRPHYSERCQQCPYTCYQGVWTLEYRPEGADTPLTSQLPEGKYDTHSGAEAALHTRPDGSTFLCFYNEEDPSELRFEKHSVDGFFASFIVFYVFAGIALLALGIIGIVVLIEYIVNGRV